MFFGSSSEGKGEGREVLPSRIDGKKENARKRRGKKKP